MKKSKIVALLIPSLLLCSSCIHADPRIEFMPPPAQVKVSQDQNDMIKQAVIKQFDLENSSSPFKGARIEVKLVSTKPETTAQVVLFYKDKYGVETYNITFDKDYMVTKLLKE